MISLHNTDLQREGVSVINGNHWFLRLREDCRRISSHIRFKRIKHGFYRIYWRQAYLHECHKDMQMIGYDFEYYEPRLANKSYYEEYEDNAELIRNVKNFIEGYRDSIKTIKTRIYLLRNDKEFYERSKNAYQQMVIK